MRLVTKIGIIVLRNIGPVQGIILDGLEEARDEESHGGEDVTLPEVVDLVEEALEKTTFTEDIAVAIYQHLESKRR